MTWAFLCQTPALGQTPGVLREVYTGIGGTSISDLTSSPNFPANPAFEEVLMEFEAPTDVLDDYGQRLTAYLIPPVTGSYVFWIASDDNGVLYLSPNDQPASKQMIASVPGWTTSRAWDWYSEQQSAPQSLVGGQRYYIEALMKEGGGGDNLAVRWQLPGGGMEEPIPASRLQVFGLGPPQITQQPAPVTVTEGGTATFTVALARMAGASFQWQRNGANITGATSPSYTLTPVSLADNNTQFRCFITNAQGSTNSNNALLTVQADTTRPTIVSVTALGDPQTVIVLFSEPVEEATATQFSNYTLNNGASVNSAAFGGNLQSIALKTSVLTPGITYTLTVNNVRDRATTPNPILPNSQGMFSIDYTPLDIGYIRGRAEPPGPSRRTGPLVFSEIMYNPAPRPDGRETEFVELYNSGETPENISGFEITGEISYVFPTNTVIGPRSYLVVAPVPSDVQAAYGISGVLGGFPQRLSNGGGALQLRNKSRAVLLDVNYSDDPPWPAAADNAGHSLVLVRPSYGEDDPRAWAASDLKGGSPGAADPATANPHQTILINEFLAHTDEPVVDFIELYNYSSQPVDLGGCILTDNPGTNKFVIPAGTVIPARGFVSFNQNQLGFALDASGEVIYLKNPADTRVIDAVEFGPQENGVSSGRFPDGNPSIQRLTSPTPGTANSRGRVDNLVINELMYHPITGEDDDEFVEIHNRGASAVNLSGWRLADGINFTFPANAVIPANGYLVVARNSARLMANYPALNAANTFGNFQGSLANGGERLTLTMPDELVQTNNGVRVTNYIHIVIDDVTYTDGGGWSRWADGGGSSIELIDPHSDNRLMSNWADSDESGKSEWTTVEHTGVLDNGQGAINELHVMLLGAGECLVDNLEVTASGGPNRVANSTFESGLSGWVIQGNHVRSGLSAAGSGQSSAYALHLRASSGGDNGANRVETDLSTALTPGNTATLRGRARWLRGHPDLLLRLHGNHIEALGTLQVPRNLGTPGAVNSRYATNRGPAIFDVTHRPILPAANQAVTITAQVSDPDGLTGLAVHYRVDPSTNYSTVSMVYNGAGFFSASLPGRPSGNLVAFYIQATDGASPGLSTRFPAAPESEGLIRFGDPTPQGRFGIYRLWMTQKNVTTWSSREKLSNEALDGTFVYGNQRVVYSAGGRYRGSPWIRPGYNSPTGNRCAYVWTLPEDDLFLGADELNLDSLEPGDRDPTALREVTSFWMADQLGLPFSYQRYIHVVVNGVPNSSRGIPIYADTQQPDSSYIRSWFADDEDGEIFKIDDWFEFNDSVGQEFNVDARLENYVTTGGVKKKARYRWNWEKKTNRTLNDDYTRFFALVDALNAPSATYVPLVENTIDADEWLTVFALRHAVGDWDGYGYNRGKNQFVYKPLGGTWRMLLWDLDFSLGCNGGHGPTQNLFDVNDPTISRLYNTPHFRRAYFQALQRIAYGPFEATNSTPFLTAYYNAFTANGVSTVSPFVGSGAQGISIPQWISQRRSYILQQVASITASFAITSNGGNNFSTNSNYITITGTAPIEVKTIQVNGVAYPVTWTSLTAWSLRIALPAAVNNLGIQGFDYYGRPVGGAQDTITITYTGGVQLPQDQLVINEIMYNPVTPESSYIEIHNRSATSAFDLSNYRLNGVGFTFPEGTLIAPGAFAVVANAFSGFASAYGHNILLAGVYPGNLDNGGETLQLIKPGAIPAQDIIVDEVTYDDDPPWPKLADGFGSSLQLIDAAQDNNRIANWAAIAGTPSGPDQPLIGIADTWRYNQAGTDLGTAWRNPGYNDAAWPSGAALLYVEPSALPGPKSTPLTLGPSTFYFRKTFSFSGSPANTVLHLSPVIDDGAVFYLNGVEVLRLGMPDGNIAYGDFANRVVDNAAFEGPFILPAANLVSGNNVLAVEIHQNAAGSSDIVMGLTLTAASNEGLPFTPGAPNSVAAPLPAFPKLWLNEIQPNNVSGLQDNAGDRDPWVEIYNSDPTASDLAGYFLSDNYTNLTRWPFPAGSTLGSGQFRLVWLDNEPGETSGTHWHANFRASPTNGSIVLTRVSGSVTTVVDYLNYNPVNADRSYGAFPDGTPAKRRNLYFATPGGTNNATYPALPVYINEWMADNSSTITDPADGSYDDWVELYNAGPVDVDLSGFTMTDDLNDINKWTIPSGTLIPAGGFLLIWADEDLNQQGQSGSDLHADFRLGAGGESIGLYTPAGTLVDSVTFGPQTSDTSQGRWPDANSAFHFMSTPTPRGANTIGGGFNSPPVLAVIGPRSGNEGTSISFVASASDPDAGQTLTFSLDPGAPPGASINGDSGVFLWTPTEAQGPGTYPVTVRVTDNASPALSDFEGIIITVNEVNTPPILSPIGNKVGIEGLEITFTALATDADIPAQSLVYSLEPGAPAGASINPATGAFTWTPSETQAPGSVSITVIVTDNGSPALNASETLSITVGEVNEPPVLGSIGDQFGTPGTPITFTATATDPDWPANTLTFSLGAGAPAGASIHPSSGVFSWTPSAAQSPGTNLITVVVTDNGSPARSASQTVRITVSNTPQFRVTSVSRSESGVVTLVWNSEPGKNYRLEYKDLLGSSSWLSAGDFPATGATTTANHNSSGISTRFYRVVQTN